MKTLANCKPSEFLKQTYRIKKSAEKWMTATDIMNIRKRLPELTKITPTMTQEEKKQVFFENKQKSDAQARQNALDIIDAVIGEHADETLEILALACFIEPEDADNHSVEEYLDAISELISNQAVINFFTSLAQLGLMDSPNASKQ